MKLTPVLTPHGALLLRAAEDAPEVAAEPGAKLEAAFARGSGHGLLCLGADHVGAALPPVFAWWRELGTQYLTQLCALPELNEDVAKPEVPPPTDGALATMVLGAPPMPGAEYLTIAVLADLWRALDAAFDAERAEAKLSVAEFLKTRNAAWNLVGRVHFNLAENRKDESAPFAFLASYTTRLSTQAKPQHLPLGRALQEYAGAKNHARLLSLLTPVQRAAAQCAWLKAMVDAGEIFHPLRWGPAEALQFLRDTPALESAGIVVRMPANWRMNRPARAVVKTIIGSVAPSQLGMKALLDFRMELTLDGEALSPAETARLLAQSDGLVFIRGKWVEIDSARLARTIEQFETVERHAAREGLAFGEAMRLLAGAAVSPGDAAAGIDIDWSETVAGPWLAETLSTLRSSGTGSRADPGPAFRGTLRPYQQAGAHWMYLLAQLGLGACLADDMGLGKTIQILYLLLVLKREQPGKPALLVAPASLLANWSQEIARFAPSLKAVIAHPSAPPEERPKLDGSADFSDADLVITSYGFLARAPWLEQISWRLAILDEAQAIRNPGTNQTKYVKRLKAEGRIALTGTPIENRPGDLWSIFDFLNPGLLGSAKGFSGFVKRLADRPQNSYAPLRELVSPYILRRLKTDRNIIADLPDKTEVKAFCPLSRRQAALYQEAVDDLAKALTEKDGIERRGIVLAFLLRLKQICNHPSHWLGDGSWAEADSGKLARLRDIAEEIAARQEKALVFTQFRETTPPLAAFLGSVFGRPGVVLTGETPVRARKDLVRRFQDDEDIPFFVLSLKAGGSGLNLTAASHVIHFDRWWNPAVENQATDRAFRIGQTRNVLVHKFVCRGTVEEQIDRMIETKQSLAGELLGTGMDMQLTEMKDEELLRLVRLDLNTAMKEG
ncbi:MAG TPA: DEAD/DEAH box helicase [Rhizomicrobium sp.]|jgi:non-specific serine/threonine protein kinase|nr:DEAD/DEAH box helicase [Rhizomicrobium sp.]